MKETTEMGLNRTGVKMSPKLTKEMVEGARDTPLRSKESVEDFTRARAEAFRNAEPLGSIPPPASVKGAAKAAMQGMKGKKEHVFLDKLGERLAFERTGTRLYDAILMKHDVEGSWTGGPDRARLEQIRDEELAHFELLRDIIEQLGADPTAVTPSADLTAVVAEGVVKAVHDSRTDLRQSLEAILVAELADNAGWELLAELSQSLGHAEITEQLERARAQEEQHLLSVKRWLLQAVPRAAGAVPAPEPPSANP